MESYRGYAKRNRSHYIGRDGKPILHDRYRLGPKRYRNRIYTADPEKDPTAKKFDKISYDEIYTRGLKVMDLTATTLCKENHLPIIVFDMDTVGNLKKVLSGENIGTLVY